MNNNGRATHDRRRNIGTDGAIGRGAQRVSSQSQCIFFNTLNDKERVAFLKGLKPLEEAARELDEDVTPERLEEFIRNHEPQIIVFAICKRNP